MARKPEPVTDPLFDVAGKTYLIAGAGGGLGGVMAEALHERGAKLVLFDTDEAALERVAEAIPDALARVADMNNQAALAEMVQLTRDRFGNIDGAINAAGLLPMAAATTFDEAMFRECIDVNLTAAFLFSRTVAGQMQDSGGRIVHIASVSSFVANPEYAAYAGSKAGLAQMVRVLAREWAPKNILINAIGPALTETPLTRDYLSDPDFRSGAIAAIPMGRLGEADDLIGTLVLLLSPGGGFITGQTIYVDGGRTLV
ncbi:MAG: oxidoreductase [Acidiferrobacteraceae bacterium]|jgi:NAD(P)-dependent dehydrogenase (short-subunit alcohol dehydrogenase family)|nr:oxidoreductase [Acidiferrobacteraceae bacterium]MDP6413275.1 SDR family oxidoreductase [Arenicellales bacterium]MDP6551122.1 SDR family oxidoreductase [Arenicellales bacterium]|tara:strand:- start:6510 stop:7280 length:771 start_codon:yes stop_codon:yes gene_type:complete